MPRTKAQANRLEMSNFKDISTCKNQPYIVCTDYDMQQYLPNMIFILVSSTLLSKI
jgi:hypothetical protein